MLLFDYYLYYVFCMIHLIFVYYYFVYYFGYYFGYVMAAMLAKLTTHMRNRLAKD